MALMAITTAISAGIQRNVAISEMKHEAKIEDIRLSLASAALTRMDTHAKRLTDARIAHATWVSTLQGPSLECYNASVADLQSAIAPKAS